MTSAWSRRFSAGERGSRRLVASALGAAVAASTYFACLTGWTAVTMVWLVAPIAVAGLFFDTEPASRRIARRVIAGVLAVLAVLFGPLGLLYLVPAALLVVASVGPPLDQQRVLVAGRPESAADHGGAGGRHT